MSAAQHDRSAGADESEASEHAIQWSSGRSPSEEQLAHIAKHRREAAEHRAAAQALRDAEARACAGIAPADRDVSPFYHREDITSVSPIERTGDWDETRPQPRVGARALFRAVPGLSTEWLQHQVDCHLARAAAVGHELPEMNYCPLALDGVTARVSSTGDGFAVDVTSDDTTVGKEILQRMQAAAKR